MTETIDYAQGETALEGYLALDEGVEGSRPGVLVIHEWSGVGPTVRRRAEELARLGYVAFAADIYGKGVRPSTPEEASREAARYRADRALLRARARAGLEVLGRHPRVDPRRLAAIGYCFGGGAVHSFTNPDAGGDPSRGAAYNAAADRRSWAAMRALFDEVLAGPAPTQASSESPATIG